MSVHPLPFFFFFFNDTATTEIYTLSLHDALPIYDAQGLRQAERRRIGSPVSRHALSVPESPDLRLELVRSRDRESGRSEEHTSELQSQSNLVCRLLLEKKKKKNKRTERTHATKLV